VFLVDDRHLADMDRHGDLVSAFSFIHLVRALAWHEPMALANRFDIDKDGVTGERDLQLMARAMANARTERGTAGVDLVAAIDARVNDVFYRQEPHLMRRYTALAFDNIRRDPAAFMRACVYRALRLFIVNGTSDSWTTQQFEGSRRVYIAATVVSAWYLLAGF